MMVLKFGGTSLATPERIRNAVAIMHQAVTERGARAMVCSAFAGVTDQLLRMALLAAEGAAYLAEFENLKTRHLDAVQALIEEPERDLLGKEIAQMLQNLAQSLSQIATKGASDKEALDHVMGFGERLSARIIATYFNSILPSHYLDAGEVIRTDTRFGHARVNFEESDQLIAAHFQNDSRLQVVTGFVARTADGRPTTLGRGGSDYTAAILGAALGCARIEIWTDVNGFMTADPNKVPEAFSPRTLDFDHALELAHFGAKVLYPPTLIPAMQRGVAVLIKNCFSPAHPGTLIEKKPQTHHFAVTGITAIDTLIEIQVEAGPHGDPDMFAKLMTDTLATYEPPISLLHQNGTTCSLFIDQRHPDWTALEVALMQHLLPSLTGARGWTVTIRADRSLVAIVGDGLREPRILFEKMQTALAAEDIDILAWGQCLSERNLCIAVQRQDQQRAQRRLHQTLLQPCLSTTPGQSQS